MSTHQFADELLALALWAREGLLKSLRWAETHCWRCHAEIGEYEDGDTCPHCGTDLVPF